MLNFIKRKKSMSFVVAIALIVIFATVVYAAYNERKKAVFWDTVTTKQDLNVQGELNFNADAEVVSIKDINPENFIDNSELAIWSGGTRWGSGGLSSVPDGWYIPSTSTYTGVTRIDVNSISPVSSVTPPFTHSMYINVWDTTTGQSASTKFVLYPDSGVSTSSWWYKKFAGKNVTFGALVNRSVANAVAAGVSTNFIRPVMNSHSIHLSECTEYWKQGDYVENDGWTLATVNWDVPASANAFEVGFAMNPTILSPSTKSTSGDSAYVVAPFLLINPLHKKYVPRPDEVVSFKKLLDPFGSGGSTFGASTNIRSMDLSSDHGWNGIVPDDAKAIYATVSVSVGYPQCLYLYGDNLLGGVSIFGLTGGTTPYSTATWIPVSSSGTINAKSIAAVSGVSLFVHAAKLR